MKKKAILLTTLLSVLCTSTVLAGKTPEKKILFRDIPWYSTKAETESVLFKEGAAATGWMSNPNEIYRMDASNYSSVTTKSDRVDGGGYRGWYSGVSVAGYDVSDTYACYVYPLDDNGKIIASDEDAEFYFGWYTFDKDDFSDHQAIYDDLNAKLSSLYGESTPGGDDYKTTAIWTDSENNIIRLLINADKDYVTLGYIAADANERLDAVQNALDQAAADAEAAERNANKSNVSGL